jgi:hypothetical protein
MENVTVMPTLHTNGTSGEELARQLETAARAVQAALTALQEAAPNARDYYPQASAQLQGRDAFLRAAEEHKLRCKRLRDTYAELLEIHEAVTEQLEARATQRAR